MIKYLLLSIFFIWSCDVSNGNELPKYQNENDTIVSNADSLSESETENLKDNPDPVGAPSIYPLYIGTYTDGESQGIYLAQFDADSGIISQTQLVAKIDHSSFQCITPDGQQIWSVSESWNGPGMVAGFAVDSLSGALTKTEEYPTMGNGPCYVSYHAPSKTVLVANYNSGNVVRISVGESNTGSTAIHQHEGKGPNTNRQSAPHAHNIHIDLTGKFAYSCDLGTDQVYVYDLTKEGLQVKHIIQTEKGAGPRHLDFHPGGKAMTVINELNSTLETYLPDDEGVFSLLQSVVSTIPTSHTTNNQCADLHYSSDGKTLYASNRGHNSIAVFSVDQITMEATLVQWMEEAIEWPRNFAISPNGKFLLAANQEAHHISVYAIDQKSGKLTFTGLTSPLSKPVCLTFLRP
ncbi:MAG: lactonase family protein [Prolixibacteraceae bacterium]|nr:lactonase family protein [Prolixibacteraceae bacterium]